MSARASVRAIAAGSLETLVDEGAGTITAVPRDADDEGAGTITAVPRDADDEALANQWLTTDVWVDATEAR
jgi:hypothetical protein